MGNSFSVYTLTLDAANQWLDWENEKRGLLIFYLGMIKAPTDTISIVLLSVPDLFKDLVDT